MILYKGNEKPIIELFDEKTGSVIRTISLHSPKEFDEFITNFKGMRCPGYGWRYKNKGKKKKGENNLVNHYHKT